MRDLKKMAQISDNFTEKEVGQLFLYLLSKYMEEDRKLSSPYNELSNEDSIKRSYCINTIKTKFNEVHNTIKYVPSQKEKFLATRNQIRDSYIKEPESGVLSKIVYRIFNKQAIDEGVVSIGKAVLDVGLLEPYRSIDEVTNKESIRFQLRELEEEYVKLKDRLEYIISDNKTNTRKERRQTYRR